MWPVFEDDRATFQFRALDLPESNDVGDDGNRPRVPEAPQEPEFLRLFNAVTAETTGQSPLPSWSEVPADVQVEGIGVPSFAIPSTSSSAHPTASIPGASVSQSMSVSPVGDVDLLEVLRRNSSDITSAEESQSTTRESAEEVQSATNAEEPVLLAISNNEGIASGSNTNQEPIVVHDTDPPFLTDGRGRVVWSNAAQTRHRGARPTARQQPKARHELTSSSLAGPPESPRANVSPESRAQRHHPPAGEASSTEEQCPPIEFITDGRGRVISTSAATRLTADSASKDIPDDDGAGLYLDNDTPDDEDASDEDEDEFGVAPSFLGRLWKAFFL